ncbi:MAG: methylmalonyl-CoA mutase family protein, partial [Gaiellaceae bacterium]
SEVEREQRIVVGVNRYQQAEETPVPTLKIDPALERQQVERVRALRERRDAAAAAAALSALKSAAAEERANLMPLLIDAARAYVTVGEICDTLREVWGVWRESPVF